MRRLILILAVVSGSLLFATAPVTADTTPGEWTPIVVNVTLDTVGSIDTRTGAVTVSGTITCDQAADGYIEGQISQVVGRFHTVRGYFSTSTPCSPEPARWTGSARAIDGKFAGSSAQVDVYSYAYVDTDPPAQGLDLESGTVRLRR